MAALAAFFVFVSCEATKNVQLTYGGQGEGLDGFLCRDNYGSFILDRLDLADGGVASASLVVDFVRMGGLPDCRSGQLVAWCASHPCGPIPASRFCLPLALPDVQGLVRADARKAVLGAVSQLVGQRVTGDAPNEFVIVRTVATSQPCSDLAMQTNGGLPDFDPTRLVGCAYSCPALLSAVSGGVFLGFDTLTEQCEQGLRVCSANDLHWQAVSSPCAGSSDGG